MVPPDLPDDLVRIILENAFVHPETTRIRQIDLMLISKHVHSWLAPDFYRYTVLFPTRKCEDLLSAFLTLPPNRLALATSVCLRMDIDVAALLRMCYNIQQLALWCYIPLETTTNARFDVECHTLRRLSMSFELGDNGPVWSFTSLRSPLFRNLTHLDFAFLDHGMGLERLFDGVIVLRELDEMTHFKLFLYSTQGQLPLDDVISLLTPNLPPNIVALVIWYDPEEHSLSKAWVANAEDCDPRLVLALTPRGMPASLRHSLMECDVVLELLPVLGERDWMDWADPALNTRGSDVWTLAEELIRRRAKRRRESS